MPKTPTPPDPELPSSEPIPPLEPQRAIRWIPERAGVYAKGNEASSEPLVLVHGAVIGLGAPLAEGAPYVSEEFGAALIEAGHAELHLIAR